MSDLSLPLQLLPPLSLPPLPCDGAAPPARQPGAASLADDAPAAPGEDTLAGRINAMLLEAQRQGVSAIHIECLAGPAAVRVRLRRDGQLRPCPAAPTSAAAPAGATFNAFNAFTAFTASERPALVARLKTMADLDPAERRRPQDGRIALGRWVPGQTLVLRLATLPTADGLEDLVLRLAGTVRSLPLGAIGLLPDTLAQFQSVIERPHGLVLCAGPAGSGRTTTLHAALAQLNTPGRKLWTAEDPVEIVQPGLRQVQIDPAAGWTFAQALPALLRADPDVVMVGAIGEAGTAQLAVEAALAGRLVLSTLATGSAPDTVRRLLDLGADRFAVADSLLAVLAQRLVRRWCRHCVSLAPAHADDTDSLLDDYLACYPEAARRPSRAALLADWTGRHGIDGGLQQRHAPGCSHCAGSGFAGRIGLHELLLVNRGLRQLIQTGADAATLQRAAMDAGMRTLRQDGIHKVLAGLTTLEEVRAASSG